MATRHQRMHRVKMDDFSWFDEINKLMANSFVMDAAIVAIVPGQNGAYYMESAPGGKLANVTAKEIEFLAFPLSRDRFDQFVPVTLAGDEAIVLRYTEDMEVHMNTLDIRMKPSDEDPNSYSVCVAQITLGALVIVKAKKDVHGGKVNYEATRVAKRLFGPVL